METISNSVLTVGVSEHGAELQSIQKNGKEYLWQGDTRFGDAVHLFSFPSWGVCGKTLTAMRAILTGWGSTALPVIWISK